MTFACIILWAYLDFFKLKIIFDYKIQDQYEKLVITLMMLGATVLTVEDTNVEGGKGRKNPVEVDWNWR